jgi:hypothetical protein
MVVIEECETVDPAVLQDDEFWADRPSGSPEKALNPIIVTNRSRIGPELRGAGLTCGLTIVAAIGVFGGAAAEVPSGGASTFLIIAAWTGMVTQGIECANSLVRIGAIATDPDANTLQQWDSNNAYTTVLLITDAVNMASNLASLPFAARNLWAILARQRSFIARGITLEMLRNMNRAQRMELIGEIVAEASRTPEGRAALIQAARDAEIGAQSIQRAASLSVRHAQTMVRIVSEETIRRLNSTLLGVVSAMAGTVVSGMPYSMVGSASGSVNWIINVIDGQAEATAT